MDHDQAATSRAEAFILLIDDEEQILRAHRSALQIAGYRRIVTCSDAREVEMLVSQSQYSVVLLDLAMPHMDGIQLLPIIRRHQPRTPVIVISAFADMEAAAGAVDSRAHDFLMKPVDRERLVDAVERALACREGGCSEYVVARVLLSDDFAQQRSEHWDVSSKEITTLLQRSREEYRHLFYGLPIAAFIFDHRTSSIVFANPALQELVGIGNDIADADLLGLVEDEAQRAAVTECLERCDVSRERTVDVQLRCHDERTVWFNMRCARTGGDNGLIRVTLLDITERKRREEGATAAHAVTERDALMREIHRQLNNCLQELAGLISLQLSRPRPVSSTDMLVATRARIATVGAVHRLLYDLSDLSEISIASIAQTVGDTAQQQVETPARYVALTVDCKPFPVPPLDVVPVARLLNELLSNSLQHAFRPDEAGAVSVVGESTTTGGYRISVCDSGHGEPPFSRSGGLGFTLVTGFEAKIAATGSFSRNTPHGTCYVIELPPRDIPTQES